MSPRGHSAGDSGVHTAFLIPSLRSVSWAFVNIRWGPAQHWAQATRNSSSLKTHWARGPGRHGGAAVLGPGTRQEVTISPFSSGVQRGCASSLRPQSNPGGERRQEAGLQERGGSQLPASTSLGTTSWKARLRPPDPLQEGDGSQETLPPTPDGGPSSLVCLHSSRKCFPRRAKGQMFCKC